MDRPAVPAPLWAQRGGYLVDLYHVCDYLAAVWPGRRDMVERHRDHLKAGRSHRVLAALRARLEPLETPDEDAPARQALRYLQNRPHQLDCPAAIAADLPIGSGLIESGNRHVLRQRLKRPGAWWLTKTCTLWPSCPACAPMATLTPTGLSTNPAGFTSLF